MDAPTINSLDLIGRDLKRRLHAPCKSITFYEHLFLAVLLGGGAGIWFTIYRSGLDIEKLSASILTYFPALVAIAAIEFIQERQPYLRAFGSIAAGFFLMIFLVAATRSPVWQIAWALLGAALAVLFWWVANGEKDCFRDVHAENATGGNVTRDLLKSDESGWQK